MATNDEKAKWIDECEKNFFERLSHIAEDISKNTGLRIVRLFGPSCSGKTTAARILTSTFEKFGKRAHVVSIDDFFYDKEELLRRSREKGFDGIDYDSPDTIDCDALKKFVSEIFEGVEAHCPVFNFKSGKADSYRTYTVDSDDIFIFEGIQANYPNVISILSEYGSASIFIAPQKDIVAGGEIFEPNILRFMRRMVRDFYFRDSGPEFTFLLWESVRFNEEKNIFPYVMQNDYSVNSAMDYEIGILKPFLREIIGKMSRLNRNYPIAEAILEKVTAVEEIPSELIRPGMLYCEFIPTAQSVS